MANKREKQNIRVTPYNDRELEHFRKLLLAKRAVTDAELDRLKNSIEEHSEMGLDEPMYATHSGDVGTDVSESDTTYALIERTRRYITQIDDALDRIENKTYGICQKTGKKISKKRLEAVPHTRFSIEAKEEMV